MDTLVKIADLLKDDKRTGEDRTEDIETKK